jgi:dihydropyrimidinase
VITFSESVVKGRLALERFVEVWATNPSQILGMYPQKGVLAEGSDADICVWDPDARWTITLDELHHDGDYSPWEGWEVKGWPATTILRGSVVVEDGTLNAEPGFGRFVPRKLDPEVLTRPLF